MYRTITPPPSEVVSFRQAVEHLRADEGEPQEALSLMISAARGRCEQFLEQAIGQQTVEYSPDCFMQRMELPFGPVHEVKTVSYLDQNGTQQTIENYSLRLDTIVFDESVSGISAAENIKIEYEAGFVEEEGPFMVPPQVVSAIFLYLGDLYANREAQFVGTISTKNDTAEVLLAPYRKGMGI